MKCEQCNKEADRITRKQGEEKFICAECRAKLDKKRRLARAHVVA